MTDTPPRPQRQTQTGLKLYEDHSPILELFANDALGWKAQTFAVETQRYFEVVYADGDDSYSWLHLFLLCFKTHAGRQARRVAGAQRTLPAVACTPSLGWTPPRRGYAYPT